MGSLAFSVPEAAAWRKGLTAAGAWLHETARILRGDCRPLHLLPLQLFWLTSAPSRPSQAPRAGDRNLEVDHLAWVAGREAETGTLEKQVVRGRTSLGGHMPKGRSTCCPRILSSCPEPAWDAPGQVWV